jgi:hypothetical protein
MRKDCTHADALARPFATAPLAMCTHTRANAGHESGRRDGAWCGQAAGGGGPRLLAGRGLLLPRRQRQGPGRQVDYTVIQRALYASEVCVHVQYIYVCVIGAKCAMLPYAL